MITCIGSVFLDQISEIEKFPKKPQKVLAKKIITRLGGSAAVACFTAKKLGMKVEFIGRFGNDRSATILKKDFKKHNINFSKSIIIKNALTSQSSVIQDNKGERLLAAYNNETLLKSKKLPIIKFNLKNVYLTDTRWIEAAKFVVRNTKEKNIKCVVDLDNIKNSRDINYIVKNSSYPIFSEIGLKEYKKNKSIKSALWKIYLDRNKFVAVTLGAKGSYWIDNNKMFHCKIPKIKVVETNCAGDVFHGAFASFLSSNKTIKESIILASATATLKCMKKGGIYSIPNLRSVLSYTNNISVKRIS